MTVRYFNPLIHTNLQVGVQLALPVPGTMVFRNRSTPNEIVTPSHVCGFEWRFMLFNSPQSAIK